MKWKTNRTVRCILAVVVCTLSLTGCSASSSFAMQENGMSSSSAPASSKYSYSMDVPMEAPAAGNWGEMYDMDAADTIEQQEVQNLSSTEVQPRKIIRNAELSLETMEYESALERIPTLTEQSGGYVESASSNGLSLYEQSRGYPSRRNAYFTVRVPAEHLDDFVSALSQEFNMVNKSESSSDITDRYYDTQAHLSNLQIQEKRLLELLEQAGKLADLLEIEKELADVRYQIETLTATMKRMDSQVAYSIVNISLEEVVEYKEVTAPPRTFGDRLGETFKDSWENFLNICENLLFGAIYLAPLVLTVAIAAVVILLIVRGIVRRKKSVRANAPDTPWIPEEDKPDKENKDS